MAAIVVEVDALDPTRTSSQALDQVKLAAEEAVVGVRDAETLPGPSRANLC